MVKDIAFVAYPSSDVAATRAWYEQKLGLSFGSPYAEDGVEKYNEAQVGNATFSLMDPAWIQRDAGSGCGVAFEVDDIEQTARALRDAGVSVEDVYETPVCKVTSFNDPEGNKVTIHQITVPH